MYKNIAGKIFTYILRDMTSPEGGFYSAEDADSEGIEGKFYVWDAEEAVEVLGGEDGQWFCDMFDIDSKGNFEGKSIPNLIDFGLAENYRVNRCRKKLFSAREQRIHPYKDDKILTSWNGLMIAALAKGARAFKNENLCRASEKAAGFIFSKLVNGHGRLMARYRDGHTAFLAYLDDYAFLVWGLLELYETTFNVEYLKQAIKLNQHMLGLFWDDARGGLFFNGKDSEELIIRSKEIYDGAIPSGNSVAALNLLKLARLTGDITLSEKAEQLFSAFAESVSSHPSAHAFLLTALLFASDASKEIVIVGGADSSDTRAIVDKIRGYYIPNAITILNPGGKEGEELQKIIPFVKEMRPVDNKATAYVCQNYTCQAPVTDINDLAKILEQHLETV